MKEPKTILRLFPWQGLLAFFAIVLPWYGGMYAIHGSDFINEFLGLHNVLRATSSEHPEDNHWYYYLILLPACSSHGLSVFEEMENALEREGRLLPLPHGLRWAPSSSYTLDGHEEATYSYIAVIPAITFAAFSALRIRMGEKLPSILGGLGLLILMAALLVGTFRLKETEVCLLRCPCLWPLRLPHPLESEPIQTTHHHLRGYGVRLPLLYLRRPSPLHDDPIRL